MSVDLQALREDHFAQLHDLFDSVCRERRFMAFTQAGPKEQTFAYYQGIVTAGHAHFVAVKDNSVVGWCDVLSLMGQMRSHSGVLGMAVGERFRGQGIGRRLIEAAIAKACERGVKRIELTVHSANTNAQALYKSVGFEFEGTQRRGWHLDGQYFDVHHMAILAG